MRICLILFLLPALVSPCKAETINQIEKDTWDQAYFEIDNVDTWSSKTRTVSFADAKFKIKINESAPTKRGRHYNLNKSVLRVAWEKIDTIGASSGACGDATKELVLKQKNFLENAKSDGEARDAIGVTTYGVDEVKLMTRGPIKIAYGIEDCHPDDHEGYDENELVPEVEWLPAIFFRNGYKVTIYLHKVPITPPVPIKGLSAFFETVVKGAPSSITAKYWNEFVKILKTIEPI